MKNSTDAMKDSRVVDFVNTVSHLHLHMLSTIVLGLCDIEHLHALVRC